MIPGTNQAEMSTEDQYNSAKLQLINRMFIELGAGHMDNMNHITATCGKMLNASTALYNRIKDGLLCSLGQWNTPTDFQTVDKPDGHICFDLIQHAVDDVYLVENLNETSYAETDPNVKKYNLLTYMGHLVRCNGLPVGSLCIVFQHHYKPSDFDKFILGVLAMALGREESMEELRKSNQRYHDLFEFSVGGVLTGSGEGIITEANKSFTELSGYPLEQLIGKYIGDVFFTRSTLTQMPLRFDLLDKGETVVAEREILHADGHHIPVEMRSKKMPDGTYQSVYQDITDRKKAEHALIASEQRQRMLLSAIPVAIYSAPAGTDIDIEYFTGNVFSLTGFHEQDFLSDRNFWRNRVHPDDIERVLNAYINVENESEISVEYRWRTANDEYKWLLDISFLINTGDKPEFLGMILDLTERKKAMEEIKSQNEQLRQLNVEKDNFFSILAHDLRSPFNGFLGLTYLLTEEFHNMSQTELREIAFTLRKSATNMYTLLENLLEWSRVHRGVIKYDPEPLVLIDLISRAIDPVTEAARNKKISLTLDLDENIAVLADAHMTETIIRNLMSNSVKFTHKGGQISISACYEEKDMIAISIRDNGIGMNKELVNKLFNINEIIKKPGTDGEPSSGLGLIICKEFINMHQGQIRVVSKEDSGTTMTFTIPALKP